MQFNMEYHVVMLNMNYYVLNVRYVILWFAGPNILLWITTGMFHNTLPNVTHLLLLDIRMLPLLHPFPSHDLFFSHYKLIR